MRKIFLFVVMLSVAVSLTMSASPHAGTPGNIDPHVRGTPGDIDPHSADTPGPGDLDPYPKLWSVVDGPTPFMNVQPWERVEAAFQEALGRVALQTFVTRRKGKIVFHDCWDSSALTDADQLAFVDAVQAQGISGEIFTRMDPLRRSFAAQHRRPHTDAWLTEEWRKQLVGQLGAALEPIRLQLASSVLHLSIASTPAPADPLKTCTTGRCDCAPCAASCDCQKAVFRGTLMVDCVPPRASCNVSIYDVQVAQPSR